MRLYLLEHDGKKFMSMTETRLDGHGFIRLQLEKHYGISEKQAQEIIDNSRIKVKKNVWNLAFVTTEDITI